MMLLMIFVLMFTACGKKPAVGSGSDVATGGNTTENGPASIETNKDDEVSFGTEGELVVFTVSKDFIFDDSSAWLGIIPTGTIYEKEADADEVDMVYCYAANFEDENKKSYRFEFEKEYFFSLGDGTYDLVLTSSDDGEIGKVLLQIGIETKGEDIRLDFENEKQ